MQVDVNKVVRVYYGRPGCACGCRGKYSDSKRQITRVCNIIQAATPNRFTIIDKDFVAIEDGNRSYCAYYVD